MGSLQILQSGLLTESVRNAQQLPALMIQKFEKFASWVIAFTREGEEEFAFHDYIKSGVNFCAAVAVSAHWAGVCVHTVVCM